MGLKTSGETMQSLNNSSRRCAHASAIFSPPGFALPKWGAGREAIVFTTRYVMQWGAKEGQTVGLADGAKNCWSVLSALTPECKALECILDWFHIAQKFQQVKNALGEAFAPSLESAKGKLWHGNADDALTKLAVLRDNVSDEVQRSKLTGLYENTSTGIKRILLIMT